MFACLAANFCFLWLSDYFGFVVGMVVCDLEVYVSWLFVLFALWFCMKTW